MWLQGVFGPGAAPTAPAAGSPSPAPSAPAAPPATPPPTSLLPPPPTTGAPSPAAPSPGSNFVPISPTAGASPAPGAQVCPYPIPPQQGCSTVALLTYLDLGCSADHIRMCSQRTSIGCDGVCSCAAAYRQERFADQQPPRLRAWRRRLPRCQLQHRRRERQWNGAQLCSTAPALVVAVTIQTLDKGTFYTSLMSSASQHEWLL
jgi:hypothetical protein